MLETQGFVLLPGLLTPDDCATLAAEVDKYLPLQDGNTARPPNSGGQRNLLKYPWCKALAERLQGMPAIAPLLPTSSVAVQCTYFEKTRARNWLVPLHQDLSIPVAERVEHPALRGWSEKDGALFVQPPPACCKSCWRCACTWTRVKVKMARCVWCPPRTNWVY